MRTGQVLAEAVSHWRPLVVALAVVAALGLVVMGVAQTGQSGKPVRMTLDEDLMKLAVVVMANQTPVTQADAQAVLPTLEKVQLQLKPDRSAGALPDDTALAALDAELLTVLPANLQSAVSAVRLLTPATPPGPGVRPGPPDGIGPGGDMPPGPPPGDGPGRPGGRGPGGMGGSSLLPALVDFFRSTAGE